MGKLIENPDGTRTFIGGFSNGNEGDMIQLSELILIKPIKDKKKSK